MEILALERRREERKIGKVREKKGGGGRSGKGRGES